MSLLSLKPVKKNDAGIFMCTKPILLLALYCYTHRIRKKKIIYKQFSIRKHHLLCKSKNKHCYNNIIIINKNELYSYVNKSKSCKKELKIIWDVYVVNNIRLCLR